MAFQIDLVLVHSLLSLFKRREGLAPMVGVESEQREREGLTCGNATRVDEFSLSQVESYSYTSD